jgi:hypothetical protein
LNAPKDKSDDEAWQKILDSLDYRPEDEPTGKDTNIKPVDVKNNFYIGSGLHKGNSVVNNLIGYKAARVMISPKLGFMSPTFPVTFGSSSISVCRNDAKHSSSLVGLDPECTCGWHSFKKMEPAIGYVNHVTMDFGTPVIRTVISGEYVEYEQGYRSDKIRVTDVLYHSCSYPICEEMATLVHKKKKFLLGTCLEHSVLYPTVFTFDSLNLLFKTSYPEANITVRNAYNVAGSTQEEWEKVRQGSKYGIKNLWKRIIFGFKNNDIRYRFTGTLEVIAMLVLVGAVAGSLIVLGMKIATGLN